jgi:hypothetical protein
MNSIVYKTVRFNELGGTPVDFSPENMMDALGIFAEEVKETENAIYLLDDIVDSWELSATKTSKVATEILDGCVDSVVTAIGILYRMGLTANQINEAFGVVADSNLSKFPGSREEAEKSVDDYSKDSRYRGVGYKAQGGGYVVFGAKSDGTSSYKILKGVGFVGPEQQLRKLVSGLYISGEDYE